MIASILFPNISPDLFSFDIGTFHFALRWYALAYIVGIIIGWWLAARAIKTPSLWPGQGSDRQGSDRRGSDRRGSGALLTAKQLEDFVSWIVIGVILGGRLGYVIFYQPAYYINNMTEILMVWQGGMSFHGGFAGVICAGLLWCRKRGVQYMQMADIMALATPPALMLGRIANFINAELWGRPTDVPWGVVFPGELAQNCPDVIGLCARHPSQLYEAILEGFILAVVLIYLVWQRKLLHKSGATLAIFLIGYGMSRFVVEFVRQPDAQFVTPSNPVGYAVTLGADYGLTMGQVLSIPMIVAGAWFLRRAYAHTV